VKIPKEEILEQRRLWKSFTEGGEMGLRKIMKKYYGTMFNYGCKFSKNDDYIKDCIQEVFIALWQYRERLDLPDSIKAYLLTALRRKMLANRVKAELISLEDDKVSDGLFSLDPSPERSLIDDEDVAVQGRLVSELLDKLSTRQREVVYLKFYQGLTREEIAKVMGLSQQSVSNLLQKAIHSLRKITNSQIPFFTPHFILLWLGLL
jgi:RNA polymerase sigma factor (sigma-70 family)